MKTTHKWEAPQGVDLDIDVDRLVAQVMPWCRPCAAHAACSCSSRAPACSLQISGEAGEGAGGGRMTWRENACHGIATVIAGAGGRRERMRRRHRKPSRLACLPRRLLTLSAQMRASACMPARAACCKQQVEQEMGPAPKPAAESAPTTAAARPKSKAPAQAKRASTSMSKAESANRKAPVPAAAPGQLEEEVVEDVVEDEMVREAQEEGGGDAAQRSDMQPAHEHRTGVKVHVSMPAAPPHASDGTLEVGASPTANGRQGGDGELEGGQRDGGGEDAEQGGSTPRHQPAPPSNPPKARQHASAFAPAGRGGVGGGRGGGVGQRRKKRAKTHGGKALSSETSKTSIASDTSMVSKVSASSRRELDEFIIDELRRKQNQRLLQILEEEQDAEQVSFCLLRACLLGRRLPSAFLAPPCLLSVSRAGACTAAGR